MISIRQLLNTLYVTSADSYLSKDGTNVVVSINGSEKGRIPIHNIESIVMFGRLGASPALMGLCVESGVSLSFMNPFGRLIATVCGGTKGNVLLRRSQYRIADNPMCSLLIARNMIVGKLSNCRQVVRKMKNNHGAEIGAEHIDVCISCLSSSIALAKECTEIDSLRGIEGNATSAYFLLFDRMILRNKDMFSFRERNRRPPRDRVNAMLSFSYSLLANDVRSALETVGLDPYVGFMHTDRPGRPSLALDLMEELRPLADRFVLRLINLGIENPSNFITSGDGSVLLDDDGRKVFLDEWQKNKNEDTYHPYLGCSIKRGLIPYVQSMLLAKHIRGEIDGYPPFLISVAKRCLFL